ncbi:MAG: two pore domain potassium channel family protein [Alphaproteobacteria bacterium]|nr:two pore domain potassium channel family protein [Alphaproteobacteria bacterium]
MLLAMVVVTVLVVVTLLIHYEVLRLTSALLPALTIVSPRFRIFFVMLACFAAHTVEVWVFGLAYLVLDSLPNFGSFGGPAHAPFSIPDYVYFSVVTYTSLGLGDIYPTGGLRLVAGVEALTGLLMIGWSASFTYIEMRELWSFHNGRRRRRSD